MNLIITILTLFFLGVASAQDISRQQISDSLKNYTIPSAEQILTAGFKMQETALDIITQKNGNDCNKQQQEKKNIDFKNKCIVCAIMNAENTKEYQLIIGTSLSSPEEVWGSYSGSNDQPLHGAFEPIHQTGDDFNGHTYGSNFKIAAEYSWGSLSLDAGTDLYVRTYDAGMGRRYITNVENPKMLQEADEHTYLRLGTKYYLHDDKRDKTFGEAFTSPYVKFGLGLEHDSDQGIGFFGGIAQREAWHKMFGVTGNYYMNHFKDQTSISTNAKLGTENYQPIGKMGFCSAIEAGLSGDNTGNLKAEAVIKAALDTGTLGGFSAKNPLFVINFETGISSPINKGSNPTIETDSTYNSSYIKNRNYSFINSGESSYASIGLELGGKELKLRLDAVYEKNQWNDGDLIYVTSLKKKF